LAKNDFTIIVLLLCLVVVIALLQELHAFLMERSTFSLSHAINLEEKMLLSISHVSVLPQQMGIKSDSAITFSQ